MSHRPTRVMFLAALIFSMAYLSLSSSAALAQNSSLDYLPKPNQIPSELKDVGIDEHLGSRVNLDLTFQDETGRTVPLRKFFENGKPVLFFLVYYKCPNLCTFVLSAAVDAMKGLDWETGKKFELVALSIDPKETPQMAAEKKKAYFNLYAAGRTAEAENGWHFLVGHQPQIEQVAQQIGFKYKWDPTQKEFAHASAMFVLTPEGKISRYFYGIQYPTQDLKVALLEASNGRMGSFVDKVLLFCYHYDASTKKYVLMASRIMTAAGALTVLMLGTWLFFAWRREQTLT